jgi:hypothetical protein
MLEIHFLSSIEESIINNHHIHLILSHKEDSTNEPYQIKKMEKKPSYSS